MKTLGEKLDSGDVLTSEEQEIVDEFYSKMDNPFGPLFDLKDPKERKLLAVIIASYLLISTLLMFLISLIIQ